MTLSELIVRLRELEAEHGSKPVALADWAEEYSPPTTEWQGVNVGAVGGVVVVILG